MLHIYCLHCVNNCSIVLVNSTAVLDVTKHCAIKYCFHSVQWQRQMLWIELKITKFRNSELFILFICLLPEDQGHLDLSCTFCSISRINASVLELSESKTHLSSRGERHMLPAAREGSALRAMHAGCFVCSCCNSLCDSLYGAQCAHDKLCLPGLTNVPVAFSPGKKELIAQCIKDPQQSRNPTQCTSKGCAKSIALCRRGVWAVGFFSLSSLPHLSSIMHL